MTQPLPSAGSVDDAQARGARIDVERVSRRFGAVEALREVSLHVLPGELVAITGRSGSGKSTLLNLIGGLDRPSEGRVLIDGVDVATGRRDERARRELVGFVFQQHLLLSELSARLNVEVPLIGAGVAAASAVAARSSCSRRWGSPTAPSTARRCSPAASASASRWRARSRTTRACCSPTSRPARSTAPTPSGSSNCS